MKNPSLREQPRAQAAPIMESRPDASILGWLEKSGRLMEREGQDPKVEKEEEMEEISALMSGDDFNPDDDDDSSADEED
ncbi:MAG: DUF3134 family protein [Thermosynechococcaceae cyanobacterium]